MEKKPIPMKELRGRYILDGINEITLNGDACVSIEKLYSFCQRQQIFLRWDTFQSDKACLLRGGYLHQEGQRLYMTKTWRYEVAAAENLAAILSQNGLSVPCLPRTLEVGGLTLSAEQKEAVSMALSHRLSIVLGGAGTGKTTLIQALVRYRPHSLINWVLCAPTGKAARNLSEYSGMEARTVHSALGKIPEQDFLAPVPWHYTGLVVVDEASMMTLEMLAGILSIAPADCRIVLVGDPNQLLSVGSGNVLPDLLALGIPSARLKACHRQVDEFGALLHNVREFQNCRRLNDLVLDANFTFLNISDESAVKEHICREGAKRYLGGEHVQVLSPYNSSGQLSVRELNRTLRKLVNPPEKVPKKLKHSGTTFYNGDRVMITENDWDRRICNGDIGTFHVLSQKNDAPHYGVLCGNRPAVWRN